MSSEFIAQLNKALQNKQVEEVIDLEKRFLKNNNERKRQMPKYTTYRIATKWCNNS